MIPLQKRSTPTFATAASIRHPELDGLRGIAILLVLIYHYSRFIKPGPVGDRLIAFANIGWSGVDLFFVLSGFLIGGILIDYRESPNLFPVFYARRALQIFPLYFLVLISYYVCLLFRPNIPYLFDKQIPIWPYAVFLQNFAMAWYGSGSAYMGATWSLAVEEQFYLLFPLIVWAAAPRKLPYLLVTAIILAIPLRVFLFHWFSGAHFLSFYVLMPCRADALSIGVLCAFVYRSPRLSEIFIRNLHWAGLFAATALLSLVFLINPDFGSRAMLSVGYTVLSLTYGAVLLICLLSSNKHMKYLTTRRWLRELGRIAFAVYLFHLAVVGFVYSSLVGTQPTLNSVRDVCIAIVAILITISLSIISWQCFERHFIAFGSKFRYRMLTSTPR